MGGCKRRQSGAGEITWEVMGRYEVASSFGSVIGERPSFVIEILGKEVSVRVNGVRASGSDGAGTLEPITNKEN